MNNRYKTFGNTLKVIVNKSDLRFNKEMIAVKDLITHALVT